MFVMSEDTTYPASTSSAEASPAPISRALAKELALLVLRAASGTSTSASSPSFNQQQSWLRMSPAERVAGLTLSAPGWESKATRAYRSRLRLLMLEHHTSELASSLSLPTLTRGQNYLSPSMHKWPRHAEARALVPTLSAVSYGSNRGGGAGRVGKVRESLATMAKKGTLLPTLVARDSKGPGPTHTKGGRDLPSEAGGHLSPSFAEWLMGFPEGWTALETASKRSETQSSLSAPKSSGTSSPNSSRRRPGKVRIPSRGMTQSAQRLLRG